MCPIHSEKRQNIVSNPAHFLQNTIPPKQTRRGFFYFFFPATDVFLSLLFMSVTAFLVVGWIKRNKYKNKTSEKILLKRFSVF